MRQLGVIRDKQSFSAAEVAREEYCKRCYFRVTKFSRLAAQKHIRGLLNSR